jgi:uncharacterized protein YneF (UPF0154 family)
VGIGQILIALLALAIGILLGVFIRKMFLESEAKRSPA